MRSLADIQQQVVRALFADAPLEDSLLALAQDPERARAAWSVHRSTVLGSLLNCLRRSYPSVCALLGEECFDSLALAFVRADPPRDSRLALYGEAFGEFIAAQPQIAHLEFVGDCARFDWLLDQLGLQAPREMTALSPGTVPEYALALRARYRVDELRDAIVAGDAEALARLVEYPGDFHYVLWRSHEGVVVRAVDQSSEGELR